jgi:hypothetical protein
MNYVTNNKVQCQKLNSCKNRNVFSFIKTFAYSFKFIIRSGVNLQQNHQGIGIRKNSIIPSSRGFDFKMKTYLLKFGIFIIKLVSNLGTTLEVVFRSFVRLEVPKMWSCMMSCSVVQASSGIQRQPQSSRFGPDEISATVTTARFTC